MSSAREQIEKGCDGARPSPCGTALPVSKWYAGCSGPCKMLAAAERVIERKDAEIERLLEREDRRFAAWAKRPEKYKARAEAAEQEVKIKGTALDEARAEVEVLIWNLAGCDTYAMGYGLDKPHDMAMARPALNSVRDLAFREREYRADADALRQERDQLRERVRELEIDLKHVLAALREFLRGFNGPSGYGSAEEAFEALNALISREDDDTVSDGFGNSWARRCEKLKDR